MSEVTLFEGSWQHGLRYLAPEVDSVVFSPPFNTGFPYDGYQDNLDRRVYLDKMAELAMFSWDFAKETACCWIQLEPNNKDHQLPADLVDQFIQAGWALKNQICWVKAGTFPQKDGSEANFGHYRPMNSPDRLHSNWGTVYMLTKGKVRLDKLSVGTVYSDMSNAKRWGNPSGRRCRGDLWVIPYETKQKTGHPCPFPVALVGNCLKMQGIPAGSVVFDPFAGSGTTGIAAEQLGMDAILCEVSSAYCEIIRKRIPKCLSYKL